MEKIKKPVPVIPLEAFTDENNISYTKQARDQEQGQEQALQTLVDTCLINLSERLEPPPVAIQIIVEGKPITLFTKGNFSIITGAAKSRKSFLISMFIVASLKGSFQDLFLCNGNGITIIFDTEQARYKVQQIAKRICNLSENINHSNLLVYSLRTLEPSQRIDIIDHVLSTTQNINFVAIDGIIDLEIDPILQADQAQRIIMKLMQWTEIYNIHITCVLHYNKTVSTLSGHLGSFSHRKADAIIEVSKSNEDKNVSIVRPVDCREKEFLPFAFSVDPDEMPYILKDYVIEKKTKVGKETKDKKAAFSFSQLESCVHNEILKSVFKIHKEQGYNDCWRNIKNAIEKIAGESIGDNKAKDFLACYLSTSDIIKKEQSKKKPVYVLPGQRNIDFE
jgi:hypothetical protein